MAERIDAHFVAVGKYHDVDFARLELLKLLAEHPQIRCTVACDYSDITRLQACSMLITYTCDFMPSVEEAAAIKDWVAAGGKWLALHGTNSILRFTDAGVDCPNERPDFMEMVGTQFKAHPPIGTFTVEVVDPEHEMTRGIVDFVTEDELYLSHTTADITTLMQTSFEGDALGFTDEKWPETKVPILYTRDIGKGRIVYNALGHCRGHYDLPGMQDFYPVPEMCSWRFPVYYDLLRRGIGWAMRKEG